MPTVRKNRLLMGLAVLAAVLEFGVCIKVCQADNGTDRGNARSEGDLLYDRWALEGRTPIAPSKDLPFFNSEIEPILQLADQVPALGESFRKTLSKKWWLDDKGVADCPARQTMYAEKGDKIACQDDRTVVISSNWFLRLNDDPKIKNLSPSQKRALIQHVQSDTVVHELLRGAMLGRNDVSEESLFEAFGLLTSHPLPSPKALCVSLREAGFGDYQTQDQLQASNKLVSDLDRIQSQCNGLPQNLDKAKCLLNARSETTQVLNTSQGMTAELRFALCQQENESMTNQIRMLEAMGVDLSSIAEQIPR
jgi:hypothetical protein